MILGLTGSIGMGKTTTAAMFRDLGFPVWDADATVALLYAEGGGAVAAIARAFPDAVRAGSVDRAALRRHAAATSEALARIEAIVHPLVAADRAAFLREPGPLLVLDIPLLFETGADRQVDRVAVVTAPPEVQRARVMARGTMTEAQFEAILARQLPDADKRARADYVIETTDIAMARDAVDRVVADMTGGA